MFAESATAHNDTARIFCTPDSDATSFADELRIRADATLPAFKIVSVEVATNVGSFAVDVETSINDPSEPEPTAILVVSPIRHPSSLINSLIRQAANSGSKIKLVVMTTTLNLSVEELGNLEAEMRRSLEAYNIDEHSIDFVKEITFESNPQSRRALSDKILENLSIRGSGLLSEIHRYTEPPSLGAQYDSRGKIVFSFVGASETVYTLRKLEESILDPSHPDSQDPSGSMGPTHFADARVVILAGIVVARYILESASRKRASLEKRRIAAAIIQTWEGLRLSGRVGSDECLPEAYATLCLAVNAESRQVYAASDSEPYDAFGLAMSASSSLIRGASAWSIIRNRDLPLNEMQDFDSVGELVRSPRVNAAIASFLTLSILRLDVILSDSIPAITRLVRRIDLSASLSPVIAGHRLQHSRSFGIVSSQKLSPSIETDEIPEIPVDEISRDISVWFNTTRRAEFNNGLEFRFSFESDFSAKPTFGLCHVTVPRGHHLGGKGATWKRIILRSDVAEIVKMKIMRKASFMKELRRSLNGSKILVFLHGFNTNFETAIRQAAQLKFDLQYEGEVAVFCWPTIGSLFAYQADKDRALASSIAFHEFVNFLQHKANASQIDLIVHSMGHMVLERALIEMDAAPNPSAFNLKTLIMAAPDMDVNLFGSSAHRIAKSSKHTTMYISKHDRALQASRVFNLGARVGFAPPVTVAAGIQTIDIGKSDRSLIGHGYFSTSRVIMDDIFKVLDGHRDPSLRPGLTKKTDLSVPYWTFPE